MPATLTELIDLLDLEKLDEGLFRGRQLEDTGFIRVFGGQVAAQALVAAQLTVPEERHVHSLHSYFLLGGDLSIPIIYDVENVRDGGSFTTRRVAARQHGAIIFYMTASFQKVEDGLRPPGRDAGRSGPGRVRPRCPTSSERSTPRPPTGGSRSGRRSTPGSSPWVTTRPPSACGSASSARCPTTAGSATPCSPTSPTSRCSARRCSRTGGWSAHRTCRWRRSTTPSGSTGRPLQDQWFLYDQHSPSASRARGLAIGRVFSENGDLVATIAQEGLIRQVDPAV